ncbi:uncharacterized protein LOC123529744 [Mercenaria mercenaria]|uniref:uncharacterized protein LOC123529744 n=1 Tax=Mercenaria mercenaria TaxID=6596 RepID=UPI00234F9461|nr:uncharacterized protein LOC123529744 [Mercenaria mercenaria]
MLESHIGPVYDICSVEFVPGSVWRPLSKLDKRECLATALQWHIEELVDGIVFKDSELPDSLLADGCLTEDECADVRKQLDRKDQVRFLLSIIKGRDFDVLKRFLKHLKSHNPTVAKSIDETFKQNKKRGMKSSKCALCKLFQVNIEYVVDILWKNNLIDDSLYNLIVRTDKPNVDPSYLWNCVIESLNKCCDKDSSHVRRIIGNALTKKHHYHHIAKSIEWMINTDRALRCRCSLRHNYDNTFLSLGSLVSSRSPKSSESELRRYSQSDLSLSTTAEIGSFEEAQRGSTPQPYEVKACEEKQNWLISSIEAVSAETHKNQKTPTDTTHEDTVDNGQETQDVLTCKTGQDNTDTKYPAESLTTTESHEDTYLGNVHGMQNSSQKYTHEQEESIKTKYTAEQNQSSPVKGSVIANKQVKTSKTDQENTETNYFVKREPHTGRTHENNVHGNGQETQNDFTSKSEPESTEIKCHEKKKSLTSAKQDNINDENEQETQNGITSKTEQDNTKIECFEKTET